ncbi:prostaglandin E synthase-like isoform X1 [Sinocyclocheilus grahami]|uniref:prostaglandin E synthase-like isoform X1 n=1 Tax=Sinocyclocheilus grahami TaxID=75366 RepID=UPI0007AD0F00|nr:PREDICTED: prostaglandin E synthase-like isoform X1 [Sinocyclocheilus grahami]
MLGSDVLLCFIFYSTLLILKMYIIAIFTGQVRLRKRKSAYILQLSGLTSEIKAFANPEDADRHGGVQFCRTDPYVERCRRAHVNDMENILPFLFLGAVYSMTGPSYAVARLHFLVFFLGRVLHSIAYLLALKAPTRSFAYVIAQVPCVSMAIQILMEVASFA